MIDRQHPAPSAQLPASTMGYECDDCDRYFATYQGLKEHWVQSPYHPYCQYCDRHFGSANGARQHFRAIHYYCDEHNRVFKNQYGLDEHYRQSAIRSNAHEYCPSCDEGFEDEDALETHNIESHHYCRTCKKIFQSASNLQTHAQTHMPRHISCPMKGCGQGFRTRPALVAHLESGSCPSRVDRATINRYVSQWDKTGVITDPSRLLTGGSAGSSSSYRVVSNIATNASWNGYGFECYLCHKEFRSLHILNQHLSSAAHDDKIYHCPLRSCGRQFHALSGLIAHIESQKCGVMKFGGVRDAMDDMFSRMDRLAIGN